MIAQKTFIVLGLVVSSFMAFAQTASKRIVVLDLSSQQFDTLDFVAIDTSRNFAFSSYMPDQTDKSYAYLQQSIPDTNLVFGTIFSEPDVASNFYFIDDYPLSAIAKMFAIRSGNRNDLCTGTMVGDKYVLASAHCVFEPYTIDILVDSIEVVLNYDVNNSQRDVRSSSVSKVYFLEDWNISLGEDIMIMELEEPIGEESGWVSIGFQEDTSFYADNVFHKFSYPAFSTPFNDYPYNGDTLFYSYGSIDFISQHYLGVLGHLKGAGGESGSSILYQDEDDNISSFGVLTWLGNYSHSKFTRDRFYAFADILGGIEVSTPTDDEILPLVDVSLYPNPTNDILWLKTNFTTQKNRSLDIFNSNGKLVICQDIYSNTTKVNTSFLESGMYIIRVKSGQKPMSTATFIKY